MKMAYLKLTGSFAMRGTYLEPISENGKLTFFRGKKDK